MRYIFFLLKLKNIKNFVTWRSATPSVQTPHVQNQYIFHFSVTSKTIFHAVSVSLLFHQKSRRSTGENNKLDKSLSDSIASIISALHSFSSSDKPQWRLHPLIRRSEFKPSVFFSFRCLTPALNYWRVSSSRSRVTPIIRFCFPLSDINKCKETPFKRRLHW